MLLRIADRMRAEAEDSDRQTDRDVTALLRRHQTDRRAATAPASNPSYFNDSGSSSDYGSSSGDNSGSDSALWARPAAGDDA